MARPLNELGRYGSVGIDLVLAILLLGGIGHWLDIHYWGNHDWGALGGFLLGVGVGVRSLMRTAKRMQRDIEAAEARDPENHRWTVDESWVHKPDDAAPDAGSHATEGAEEKPEPDDRPN
jgi:hypothetical protein